MERVERLTSRDKKGRAYFDDDGSLIRGANGTFHQKKDMTAQIIHQRFVALDKTIDRLAAYEDTGMTPGEVAELARAKSDGRLVVLPCKVGDTVYDIEAKMDGEGDIMELKVPDIHIHVNKHGKLWIIIDGCHLALSEFGETIFRTREEAEAALKKQKEEHE